MVAVMQLCRQLTAVVVCTLSFMTLNARALVHEVNSKNLDQFLKRKLFTLIFTDSPTCSRCRLLYPFFVQASQVFPDDPEIFFARTHDRQLLQKWEVSELPAVLFYVGGRSDHHFLDLDMTVDDIVDSIARVLHGNFAGLSRTYMVHVTPDNYQELIVTPKQHVLLLLHDKKDREAVTTLGRVAYAFRKDDAILFATLDVSKQKALRDEKFKTRETPVLMWLQANEKDDPKRFGGVLTEELITMFVNERTGLHRNPDGGILQEAGRIPAADILLEEAKDDIHDVVEERLVSLKSALSALRPELVDFQVEMLEYYMFVLDNIAMVKNSGILRELIRGEEEKLLEKEELSTKRREMLKRRRNVLIYIESIVNEVKESRKRKKEESKTKKSREQILTVESPSKHTHEHIEL